MRIKGFQKSSLIEFSPNVAAVLFTGGCNFRCGYCYNPDLVLDEDKLPDISERVVFEHLDLNRDFLDGVCITGGEPCIQPGLPELCRKLKGMGLLVKVSTNGSRPDVLRDLVDNALLDSVSMDVKAPLSEYNRLAGVNVDTTLITESINLLEGCGIDVEFHITPVPGLIEEEQIEAVARDLIPGTGCLILNTFQPERDLVDTGLRKCGRFTREEMEELMVIAEVYIRDVRIL